MGSACSATATILTIHLKEGEHIRVIVEGRALKIDLDQLLASLGMVRPPENEAQYCNFKEAINLAMSPSTDAGWEVVIKLANLRDDNPKMGIKYT